MAGRRSAYHERAIVKSRDRLTRSSGLAFIVTLSSIKSASSLLRANLNLQGVLRLTDGNESEEIRRTFRLTPAQHEYQDHRLAPGEIILRLGHRHPEPILATFERPAENAFTITSAQWQQAKAVGHDLIKERTPRPTTPPTTGAPTQNEPSATRPVALNDTEERLGQHIAKEGITLVSQAYDAIGVHYQAGDRAKAKLIQLGLITATPIKAHGRQGARAVALELTHAGEARLGKTSPRTRGGAQHRWIITRLQAFLPGSSREVTLKNTAVDLLVRFDPAAHNRFAIALHELGHTFTNTIPNLTPNALCAIEVECSDVLKTGPINCTKKHAAGIDWIVLALMPNDVTNVIEELPTRVDKAVLDHVIVINALTLLDTLRTTEKGTP